MKSSKEYSAPFVRIQILLCISATVFLIQSCKSDIKETQPEATIVEKGNITETVSETADEILAREKAWAAALVAGDLVTVTSIMHRDFRLVRVYDNSPPFIKEMYLGMEGMTVSSADVTSVTVTEEAGPIVVSRTTWSMDWEQQGIGKLPSHFDMVDTWIKSEDDVWHVLARVSQIAEGQHRPTEEK